MSFKDISKDRPLQELRDKYKVPFSCYACNKLMYNWDSQYFYRHGVCAECTINYIEDRDLDENLLKDREKILSYIKEEIQKKKNRKLSENTK